MDLIHKQMYVRRCGIAWRWAWQSCSEDDLQERDQGGHGLSVRSLGSDERQIVPHA